MKLKILALLIVAPILLTGCGGDAESKKEDTQVAVKVNGQEVTVHQLNQVLQGIRVNVTAENQTEIKQKALDNLIDQTLVLQAAKSAKLDRTPEVLSALEAAKRKVLVDSYIQRTLQGVGKPTADEIEAFYASRPEIFNDRKLFVYSQITLPAKDADLEKLVEKVKGIEDYESLLAMFKAEGLDYKELVEAKTSEKVAAPLLKPLNTLKAGDIGYLKMSDGLLVISLKESMSQPVSLERAKSAIERQLYSQKQKEAAAKLVESLKESAQVEYLGDFKPVEKAE